jgi:tetratricopeptide (TPR) repeat protein
MTPQQAMTTALGHHQAGALAAAARLYQRVLIDEPVHPDALRLLGTCRLQEGHNSIAAPLLAHALRIDPKLADAAANLVLAGRRFDEQGRLENALAAYRPAYEAAGNIDLAGVRMLWALMRLSRREDAILLCHDLLERTLPSPKDEVILDCVLFLIDLGTVDASLLRKAALEWARPVLRMDPRSITAATTIAQYLYLKGRTRLLGRLQKAFYAQFDDTVVKQHNKLRFWYIARFDEDFFAGLPEYADVIKAFPPMYGLGGLDAPSRPDRGVIFVSGDEGYFNRFGALFLERLRRVDPTADVHLHIINPGPRSLEAAAGLKAGWAGRLNVTVEQAQDFTRRYTDQADVKTYFASVRFVRVAQLLPVYRSKILVIDIDTVLRRDLAPLMDARSCDALVRYGNKMGPTREYLAGAILFDWTDAALRYLQLMTRYLGRFLSDERAYWTLDQAVLYCCADVLRRRPGAPKIGFYGPELDAVCGFAMGDEEVKASYMHAETSALETGA